MPSQKKEEINEKDLPQEDPKRAIQAMVKLQLEFMESQHNFVNAQNKIYLQLNNRLSFVGVGGFALWFLYLAHITFTH